MFRYVSLLEKNVDNLAKTVSREHGKTHAEAIASVRRGIEMVEYACPAGLTMGDTVHNPASDVDCETYSYPLGVCAGITPYNFPLMVPLWMFIMSPRATHSSKRRRKVRYRDAVGRITRQAGLPSVFNIVRRQSAWMSC
jgi:malonate-semialdehyde dehydrogenase (acetylating)/methylmalonate-semialdehyde dehydrogenase